MTDHKLTLGPVLFHWDPNKWRDFYFRIADEADVDSVCVGEVVCSKRAPFLEPHLPDVIERLQSAGKEVLLSSLALVMSERERKHLDALCETDGVRIEANDISAAARLKGRPFAVGPFVNVYNEGTLRVLADHGAVRVSLPGELPSDSIRSLAFSGVPVELEVQVFGRLPLAISARCYHARSRGLAKDSCQYACADDPDGMTLDTLDGDPFLAINGTQTLSHSCVNLLEELEELEAMSVMRYRLSPQDADMVEIAELYRGVCTGALECEEAEDRLIQLIDMPFSNGFFWGVEGRSFTEGLAELDG